MNGVIIYDNRVNDSGYRLYRDIYNCKICGGVVIYMGLDKTHSDFCQLCQDEFAKGRFMSSKFRKMWKKSRQKVEDVK